MARNESREPAEFHKVEAEPASTIEPLIIPTSVEDLKAAVATAKARQDRVFNARATALTERIAAMGESDVLRRQVPKLREAVAYTDSDESRKALKAAQDALAAATDRMSKAIEDERACSAAYARAEAEASRLENALERAKRTRVREKQEAKKDAIASALFEAVVEAAVLYGSRFSFDPTNLQLVFQEVLGSRATPESITAAVKARREELAKEDRRG